MTTGGPRVRRPAVAGAFYPAGADALAALVDRLVGDATPPAAGPPKALVVPHAGYVYSGPIAGSGYAALRGARGTVRRVVLIGPAHYVAVAGLAVSGADAFLTPLGPVEVDDDARRAVLAVPGVHVDDDAHLPEHSLEVHLPFLQRTLGEFRMLPIVVGRADPDTVAAALDAVWGGPETLVVVSSDLSHYHDLASARTRDARTAAAIVAGDLDRIAPDDACGAVPVRGLLATARRRGLHVRLLDLRTSGDTAGPPDRVVGYGAFAVEEEAA